LLSHESPQQEWHGSQHPSSRESPLVSFDPDGSVDLQQGSQQRQGSQQQQSQQRSDSSMSVLSTPPLTLDVTFDCTSTLVTGVEQPHMQQELSETFLTVVGLPFDKAASVVAESNTRLSRDSSADVGRHSDRERRGWRTGRGFEEKPKRCRLMARLLENVF
jgi:hypothetical protein